MIDICKYKSTIYFALANFCGTRFGRLPRHWSMLQYHTFHFRNAPRNRQTRLGDLQTALDSQPSARKALQKMGKVDSFMRENQRTNGIDSRKYLLMSFAHLIPKSSPKYLVASARPALRNFTLSDTFIPAGTTIAVPAGCTHIDSSNYDDPTVFKPWRFSDMREEDGEGTKHHFVGTSPNYIMANMLGTMRCLLFSLKALSLAELVSCSPGRFSVVN